MSRALWMFVVVACALGFCGISGAAEEQDLARVFKAISAGDEVILSLKHGARFKGLVAEIESRKVKLDLSRDERGVRGFLWFPAEVVESVDVVRKGREMGESPSSAGGEQAPPASPPESPEKVFAGVEEGCLVRVTLRHGATFSGIVSKVTEDEIAIVMSKHGVAIGEVTFPGTLVANVRVSERGLPVPEIGVSKTPQVPQKVEEKPDEEKPAEEKGPRSPTEPPLPPKESGKEGEGASAEAVREEESPEEEAQKEKWQKLLEKFPPSKGWNRQKYDELKNKFAVMGFPPTPEEQEFIDNFEEWEKAVRELGD